MITRSLGTTLRAISPTYRARIRALYRSRVTSKPFDRQLLENCIFEVQNELEHRQHDHPQVAATNATRNLLLDDLGVNESRPGLRWPHVERIVSIIAEKRRVAPPKSFQRAISTSPAEASQAALNR